MNIQKNAKKFILVLVLLILFNFCYPKKVNAGLVDDIVAAPAKIFWLLETGVLSFLNNVFTEDSKDAKTKRDYDESGDIVTSLKVYLTPETIIKGKYILFDANIFKNINNSTNDEDEYYDDGDGGIVVTEKKALRETISGWYYTLRNFAIVALLSVLVYVGIRMIISTVAQDKAKYKVMFKDWLIALCLVIVMHFMMIAILNITSMITDALGGGANTDMIGRVTSIIEGVLANDENVAYTYTKDEATGEIYTLSDAYANILVLMGIIIYTFIFAVKYLKREFTIIFLILLGPVSCITYPIDKISDGKAQAFNKWFSEFLYQVIIQPFHLLLYIVLIGTSAKLANANVIYALVCFAVMIPAEKFIKEMFGFKDKLGSPLGAMATGAMASQLFNKMKGGGSGAGSSGNGDNDSTGYQLPAKTVDDKNDLIEGKGDSQGVGDNSEQNAPRAIGDGADSEENIDDGADKPQEIDGADSEEYIDDGADKTQEKDGDDSEENIDEGADKTQEKDGDDSSQIPKSQDGAQIDDANKGSNSKKTLRSKAAGFVKNKANRARAIHNQRMSKKWGSASRGQRWINRGKKILGGTAKFATRTAFSAAGALALGTIGFMTGQGAKGALAGAAIGNNLGNKAIKGVSNVGSDYYNGMLNDEHREKKEFRNFEGNKQQIDKAVLSYRKNHDGQDPDYEDLNNELKDRYELSRYGLSDDQIDDVLPMYQEKKDELLKNGKSEEDAQRIAAGQAKHTAKLAKFYGAKELKDPKKLETAFNSVRDGLKGDTRCSDKVASDYAKMYLTNAAKMHGVSASELKFPGEDETVTVPLDRPQTPNMAAELGIEGMSDFGDEEIERMNHLTFVLQERGYTPEDISIIARQCSDSRMPTIAVLDKYEASVKYLEDSNAQEQAKIQIESINGGKNATAEQLRDEMKERLILKSTFNVKDEGDISALRDLEHTGIKEKTQVQMARDFAVKHKGELLDTDKMDVARDKLIQELVEGGSSKEKAQKDAQNIINLAGQYNNEIKLDKTT